MDHERDRIDALEGELRRFAPQAEREQLEREISGNLSPADEEIIDLREERLRYEAIQEARNAEPNPFGSCPECGKGDTFGNIGRLHFFYCDEHRITWLAGSNLFSSWREEGEDEWRETWERVKGHVARGE